MIDRYWGREMKELWDGNYTKYALWLKVELAVLDARERLGQIPRGTFMRVQRKLDAVVDSGGEIDVNDALWRRIVEAIESRDKVVGHDFNAFLEVIRAMIILPATVFASYLRNPSEKELDELVAEVSSGDQYSIAAAYFHDGMTSYDTEEPAMALLFDTSLYFIDKGIQALEEALVKRAEEHRGNIMIGRTHGQHAQPITFGIKCLNWLDAVTRARENLKRAAHDYLVMKLSGAVGIYGTLGPDAEDLVGDILGLDPVIATQIVSLDYRARIISEMAIASSVIEKIANDLWLMSQTEIREIQEPFGKKQKGSSAMPHKKNPINLEKLRGLAPVVRGMNSAMMESVRTSNERCISHSSAERIIHQTAFAVLDHQLTVLTRIISEMTVFSERMPENIEMTYGVIASQKLEMLFKEKGMPAELAYRTVQEACFVAVNEKIHLQELILNAGCRIAQPVSDMLNTGRITTEDVKAVFDWKEWVKGEDHIYEMNGFSDEEPDEEE